LNANNFATAYTFDTRSCFNSFLQIPPGNGPYKAKTKTDRLSIRWERTANTRTESDKKSRCKKIASESKKEMQFLDRGKYIALIANGKVYL